MLWIEKYRPERFEDLQGQDTVREHLISFAETGNVPHLLLVGPSGTGKTVAIECLARSLYGDYWKENTAFFNAYDLFSQGKSYLQSDDRFSHLFQKDASLISNFKYIVKWYASLRPLDAEFKLMVFEDASALTFEAQQALRRIMEHFSKTCRFIFAARTQSGIIPAISSRCLPLIFSSLPAEVIAARLEMIMEKEGVPQKSIPAEDLELIIQSSGGDIRKAIMTLEVTVKTGKELDLAEIMHSETETIASDVFSSLRAGNMKRAKSLAETLMIEYGLSGREFVAELRKAIQVAYNKPGAALILADTDHVLGHAGSDFLQIEALLARIMKEVYP